MERTDCPGCLYQDGPALLSCAKCCPPEEVPARDLAQEMDADARRRADGPWFPACGGAEQPFTTRAGLRLQYMWQPTTRRHAYYDLDRDLFLNDDEAERALA